MVVNPISGHRGVPALSARSQAPASAAIQSIVIDVAVAGISSGTDDVEHAEECWRRDAAAEQHVAVPVRLLLGRVASPLVWDVVPLRRVG